MRSADDEPDPGPFSDRLSDLSHNYRVQVEGSRAIALASGFAATAEPDDPLIWTAVARGEDQGDLRVRYWENADELHASLLEEIQRLIDEAGDAAGLPA